MRALVVFDSVSGNTQKVADAIAAALDSSVRAVRVTSAEARQLDGVSLLVVGSPTLGGRPTEAMREYLEEIAAESRTLRVAVFDTRLNMRFVKVFGYAADKMAARFREMGSAVPVEPAGFIVKGRTGPLAEGEMERAAQWGRHLQDVCAAS